MNKLKENCPLYFMLLAFFIINLFFPITNDDLIRWNRLNELTYFQALNEALDFSRAISPRYLIYILVYSLLWLKNPQFIWALLNTFMMFIIIKALRELFFTKRQSIMPCLFFISLYPYCEMKTAGIISTTIGYLWVLAALLVSILYMKKAYEGERFHIYDFFIYAAALCLAVSQEQSCAALLLISITAAFIFVYKKRGGILFCIFSAALCLLGLKLLFFSSSQGRYSEEIYAFFPDYKTLTFINKIEMAFTSSMFYVLLDKMIFFMISIFIMAAVCKKYNSLLYRILSVIPVLAQLFIYIFFKDTRAFSLNQYGLIDVLNYNNVLYYLPIFIIFCMAGITIINLWILSRNAMELLISAGIIIIGLMTRMMMAFSPTIWASSSRTFIFFDFALLMEALYLYNRYYEDIFQPLINDNNYSRVIRFAVWSAALVSFVNNYIILLYL